MNSDLARVGLAFGISLLLSLALMPVAVSVGRRLGMTVQARYFRNSRSSRRMSYLGGVAVATAAIVGAFIAKNPSPTGIVALQGGLVFLALGFPEVRTGHKTHFVPKFLVQGLVAAIVWWFTLRLALPGPAGGAITVLVLVTAANAFNWLDNMNAVAGVTAASTGAGIATLALLNGSPAAALPAVAICGASLGFLPFNWRKPKAYLGGGAPEMIGFVLAAGALSVSVDSAGLPLGLLVTLCLLIVPAIDLTVTLLSRITGGRHPFRPGTDHISHRLYRRGYGRRKTAVLHGLAALGGAAAALSAGFVGTAPLVAVPVLYLLFGLLVAASDHRRMGVKSWRGRVVKYAVLLVIVVVGAAMPTVAFAAWDMREAKQQFSAAIAATKAFELDEARQYFEEGGRLAEKANSRLELPITLPARFVPVAGDNIRAAEALAEGAALAAPAADTALEAAQLLGGPELLRGGFSDGRIPVDALRQAAEQMGQARAQAELALAAAQSHDGIILPPLSGARREFTEQMGQAIDSLYTAEDASWLLPHFFGADQGRRWLLIIQNPAEQRATGGFLGAFGILAAEDGGLSLEQLESNVAYPTLDSNVPAPKWFAENYDRFASRSNFRNANMSPDFPTVAGVLSAMWEQGTGQPVDGVIAVDAIGLNHLLELVGPVSSPEVGEITSGNFLDLALNEAYIRFPEKEERSSFLLEVGREVWSRLLNGNFSNARQVVDAFGQMAATKRIQVYAPGEQERIERLGISGALEPVEGDDYLMLVGQNAGGNKLDYYAERSLTYRVDLTDPDRPRGELQVQVHNPAPDSGLPRYVIGPNTDDLPAGLNRLITSVYGPEFTGVTGVQVDGEPSGIETYEELGLGVVSKVLDTPAGATTTMTLQTRPVLAARGRYRLLVQQQPTLRPDKLELQIVLPAGVLVHEASGGLIRNGNLLSWSGELDRQRDFTVDYGPWLGLPAENLLTNN